jgi:hypothetical protein
VVEIGVTGYADPSRGSSTGVIGILGKAAHEQEPDDDVRRCAVSVYEGIGEYCILEAVSVDEARLCREGGVGLGSLGTLKCRI